MKRSFADVVFSGLGWTSLVTPRFDRDIHLRSVSPEGVGIFLREVTSPRPSFPPPLPLPLP